MESERKRKSKSNHQLPNSISPLTLTISQEIIYNFHPHNTPFYYPFYYSIQQLILWIIDWAKINGSISYCCWFAPAYFHSTTTILYIIYLWLRLISQDDHSSSTASESKHPKTMTSIPGVIHISRRQKFLRIQQIIQTQNWRSMGKNTTQRLVPPL